MPEVFNPALQFSTLLLLFYSDTNKLPICTSSNEFYFLSEQLHKIWISPNSLHQTKEETFPIYWVIQDLSMLEKCFFKWVFQQKQLTYHFSSDRISNTSSAPNPDCPLTPGFVLLYRQTGQRDQSPGSPLPLGLTMPVTLWGHAHLHAHIKASKQCCYLQE